MPITISGSTGIAGVDGSVSTPAVQGTDTNTGVYYPAADQVAIATGGVQRLLVDATGTVTTGVGALYPLVSGTAVASTSGTSIDFTGIPSWVKRITVMLIGVSTNGTTGISLQIGDAGGIETTGYAVGTSNGATSTSEFPLTGGSGAAAGLYSGGVILALLGSNTWSIQGVVGRSDVSAAFSIGGSKALSDTLTQVRLKSGNGTDTFDAGSINILYE